MTHYTLHVPVEGQDRKKHYPRVGGMFENTSGKTGEIYHTIKLDFPVAVTEFLAFPPKAGDAGTGTNTDTNEGEGGAGEGGQ